MVSSGFVAKKNSITDQRFVRLEVHGFKELAEAADKLPDNIRKRLLEKLFRDNAKKVADQARSQLRSLVRQRTGRLLNAIDSGKVPAKHSERNEVAYEAFVAAGQSASDKSGAFYAHFVEWGHVKRGGGGSVQGRPFMGNAADIVEPVFFAEAEKAIMDRVEKFLSKGK